VLLYSPGVFLNALSSHRTIDVVLPPSRTGEAAGADGQVVLRLVVVSKDVASGTAGSSRPALTNKAVAMDCLCGPIIMSGCCLMRWITSGLLTRSAKGEKGFDSIPQKTNPRRRPVRRGL